ncbi:MAG: hypothetical protein ACLUFV_06175 [Acutalibacteraceae bacterium]
MDITVNPGRLSGTVAAPSVGPAPQCIAAAFCGDGGRGAAAPATIRATLDCLAAMGFSVGFDGESVRIGGRDRLSARRRSTAARAARPPASCRPPPPIFWTARPRRARTAARASLCGADRRPARQRDGGARRFPPIAVSGGLHAACTVCGGRFLAVLPACCWLCPRWDGRAA